MFNSKSKDLKSLERSIILLAGYHAVRLDNEQFLKSYRHLISLYITLCQQKGHKPCLTI